MTNIFRLLDDDGDKSVTTSHSEFELFLIANDLEMGDTILLKISGNTKIRGVLIDEDSSKNPIIRTEDGEDVIFNKNSLLSVNHKPAMKIFNHSKNNELRLSDIKKKKEVLV